MTLSAFFFFLKRGRKRRKGGGIKSLSLPELHTTTTTAIRYSVLYERCNSLLLFLFLFVPRFIAAPWRKMAHSYDDEGCYFPSLAKRIFPKSCDLTAHVKIEIEGRRKPALRRQFGEFAFFFAKCHL